MSIEEDDVERLRARVANLERMVDRLAHELTTPLTTAHGFARVLLAREDLDGDVRAGIERIERASGTALAMLRSRLDEAVGDTPRSVRLRTLVRDVVTSALGNDATAGHDLPEDARVFADLSGLRAGLSLLLVAIAEHAASRGVDPTTLTIDLVEERRTAYQLRLELAAPSLSAEDRDGGHAGPGEGTADDVAGRLRRAQALFGPVGARVWLDNPAVSTPELSVLLELPRDVET